MLDVDDFRTADKEALLERVYAKTRKHWAVARTWRARTPWDFFMLVEMGLDRIHHGFWSYMDPEHHKYEPGNPFEQAIRDYYRYLDGELAALLELVPRDTLVLVVSDHGSKRMEGGICFNEWLIREGYLTLEESADRADADRQGRDRLEPDQSLGLRRDPGRAEPLPPRPGRARRFADDPSSPPRRSPPCSRRPPGPPSTAGTHGCTPPARWLTSPCSPWACASRRSPGSTAATATAPAATTCCVCWARAG